MNKCLQTEQILHYPGEISRRKLIQFNSEHCTTKNSDTEGALIGMSSMPQVRVSVVRRSGYMISRH